MAGSYGYIYGEKYNQTDNFVMMFLAGFWQQDFEAPSRSCNGAETWHNIGMRIATATPRSLLHSRFALLVKTVQALYPVDPT